MKGTLRRTVSSGPATALTRGLNRMIRRRARVLAMCVVVSMLAASLPASSANTQGLSSANGSAQSSSLPADIYHGVSQRVASLGAWVAGIFTSKVPETTAYEPVAAYISPAPPFIDAPTNLSVTAAAAGSISLSWTAPGGSVDHYQIERATNVAGPFFFLTNVTGATTHNDNTVVNQQAYLYRVRAVTSVGLPSAPSNMALGTAISFQFANLQGQQIKAQHFHDVRTAINSVRAIGNLTAATWARANLLGLDVLASDVNEMRNKLNEALTALSIPVTAYTDPTLQTGASGTLIKGTHIQELQTRSTKGSSTSFGPIDSDSSTARLDPLNETGGGGDNPLSRNFNWSLPLVNLPGRAGLNLGLSLAYNSLVWTKSGNTISFDDDNGFPAPGFRLGFPVIQQLYYNTEVGKQAFLLVSPDGSRTELRQVGATDLYEAADSSYLLLDAATMVLRTKDGTQFSYVLMGGEFNCTQVKDRNGNYITVNYTGAGRIDTVVDTLARSIKFNYDANGWLTSITQLWNQGQPGEVTHNWARFEYANVGIDYNFGTMTVFGPADSSPLKMLSRVKLADDSYFDFSYTNWGQVWKVTNYAPDNSPLNYRSYNLPTTTAQHDDCPRFTSRKDWAKYWNGDTDGTMATNEEAATNFIIPASDSWTMPDGSPQSGTRAEVTTPDGTVNKIYYIGSAGTASGWRRGLPALIETHSGGSWQRKTMTTWMQDNTSLSYQLNPRVSEKNVYDPAGNRARTEITFQQFTFSNGTSCHLPRDIYEYAANATTKLRSTRTDYNTSTSYTNRRIISLVSERRVYEGDVNGTLKYRQAFNYDETGSIQGTDAPIQHDNTNYTASFVAGRGNLSSVKRHDVTNTSFTTTSMKYNTAGSLVSSSDALNREVTFNYADSFSDGNNLRNTLAYPTTVTDEGGYSSTSKYHFDFGAVTYTRTPQPNVTTNTAGPEQTSTFDPIGRVIKITNLVNNAYTEFEYPTSNIRVDTFRTIEAGQGEAYSFTILDGHRRVVGEAKEQPGTSGGKSGRRIIYDVMGRVFKTSNPTETAASGAPSQWTATGDDATAGWLYTQQTYDWNGRPLVTTNPDGTIKTGSYAGCGCAGGEVATFTDEGTLNGGVAKKRQQKVYSDVLGRAYKAEILNWEGGSVYSTTVKTFNALDQITQIRQYEGLDTSSTYQDTTMTYDGYGRLETSHSPNQIQKPNDSSSSDHTSFFYNADDTIHHVIDARGVVQSFTYNSRRMVTSIAYDAGTIPYVVPTATVTFTYDAVGNRKSMNDGTGSITYQYNNQGQLSSETRQFSGTLSGTDFALNYQYNLAGELKKITDHTNTTINYNYNKVGQLTGVTGEDNLVGGVSNYASGFEYRAWGGIKEVSLGNGTSQQTSFNSRLLPTSGSLVNVVIGLNQNATMSWTYDYYADGRQRHAYDANDDRFDRLLEYDHGGRMIEAYSGREARGLAASNPPDSPYRQSFLYNAFDERLQKSGRFWRTPQSGSTPCIPRQTNDNCDPEGNVLSNIYDVSVFDAAGKQVSFKNWLEPVGGSPNHPDILPRTEIAQTYDGDGAPAKRIETRRTEELIGQGPNTNLLESEVTTYYIYSTVLGGQKVVELDASGFKNKGYVYANGTRLAKHDILPGFSAVLWHHANPGTNSWVETGSERSPMRQQMDPDGSEVGTEDPWASMLQEPKYENLKGPEPLYLEGGNPFDFSGGFEIDGLPVSAQEFARRVGDGTGSVTVQFQTRDGQWHFGGPNTRIYSGPNGYSVLIDKTSAQTTGIIMGTDKETGKSTDVIIGVRKLWTEWKFVPFGFGFRGVSLLGLAQQQKPKNPLNPIQQERMKEITNGYTIPENYFNILEDTKKRVIQRLENPKCRALIGNSNYLDILENKTTISPFDQQGVTSNIEGVAAETIIQDDDGNIVLNGQINFTPLSSSPFFFSGLTAEGFGIKGRKMDQNDLRDLVLIHELVHTGDATGKYADVVGIINSRLNRLIAKHCF